MSAGAALNLATLTEDDRAEMRAMQAEERLIDFIRLMWPAVEPARPFISNWVIESICEHLEAVTAGDITRLIINCPPGMTKSLTTQVFWPCWEWLRSPSTRYVCVSYTSSLTERDNARSVQLLLSPLYQKHWGGLFRMTQTGVGQISNNKTGWKMATSVDGVGTGARGDRVVLDDLISVKQADSTVVRDTAQRYVRETLPTRMNDPRTSAIVAIEQRTHEDDATGTLLSDGGDYTHLMIPMEWDGRRYHTSIGWTDPRTVEDVEPGRNDRSWYTVRGELCFPERFPAWVVERDKRAMGQYAVASQFQQTPAPRGGAIIRDEWWQPWDPIDVGNPKFPPFDDVIAYCDGAFTESTVNDRTALAVLGTFTEQVMGLPKVMLVQCWADRMALSDVVVRIDQTCRRYKVSILLVENKATGHSVVQELHRIFIGKPYSVVLADPKGSNVGRRGWDKVARVSSVVPLFEDGMIYAPRVLRKGEDGRSTGELWWTDWADETIREMSLFPRGRHDDRCFVAGTLVSTRRGAVPIEDVRVGDEVFTPLGFRRVVSSGLTGLAETIAVGELRGTGCHPVFSYADGYRPLDTFTGVQRWIRLSLCGLIQLLLLSKSSSMASFTAGWEDEGGITFRSHPRMLGVALRKACMWRSGRSITGGWFLRGMKSITSIMILSIAILPIWIAYRKTSIGARSIPVGGLGKFFRIWKRSGLWLPNGIHRKTGLRGIGSMPRIGGALSHIRLFARAVGLGLRRAVLGRDFVPFPAGIAFVNREGASVLERGPAIGVGNSSRLTGSPGGSVASDVEEAMLTSSAGAGRALRLVFNLSVEWPCCYFANGVLVHNCDAVVGALRWMRDAGMLMREVEAVEAERDAVGIYDAAGRQPPLYRT